jgi:uncharacterized protein YndB with AHSA1/START domain
MSKRVDSTSRFIPVAPSTVDAAFAEPRAMERWVPPKNMTATILHFEFREGGAYRMRLTYKEPEQGRGKTSDSADEVEVRFVKLISAKRIEQAVTFESNDSAFSGVMRMTWTFDQVKNGTLVTIRAEDVPPGISPDDHVAGMTSTLENLGAFLEDEIR